jgi:hypothetical protein
MAVLPFSPSAFSRRAFQDGGSGNGLKGLWTYNWAWKDFGKWTDNRGVADILIAVVDGLKGFPESIEAAFPQTTVQTCIVHLIRNSLDLLSWSRRKAVANHNSHQRRLYTAGGQPAVWQDRHSEPEPIDLPQLCEPARQASVRERLGSLTAGAQPGRQALCGFGIEFLFRRQYLFA